MSRATTFPRPAFRSPSRSWSRSCRLCAWTSSVLDAQGEEIELRDDEEEGYQNFNQIRDDDYTPYHENNDADAQFSAAGYTIKETSDDDDFDCGRHDRR